MDNAIYVLHSITSNGVWVITIAVFLLLIFLTRRKFTGFGVLVIILAVLNFIFGSRLTNTLVYKYGKDGSALITDISETNDVYNYRPVMEYRTIIHTANGMEVNTTFRSDAFNIYPLPKTGYVYPRQGVPFKIKYLEKHPGVFVITAR